MKKTLSVLLACMLVLSAASALADDSGTKYTMDTAGATVLQNVPDRAINVNSADLEVNPVISGESTTTGLPLEDGQLYLPMLVQISNPTDSITYNGKKTTGGGLNNRAPWGGQYADIVYEGILYRTGETRITFMYSDSFAEGQPVSAGPVRSARIGHVLLREEWQGGIVYAGGPRAEENNIAAMFAELGASDKGVTFNLLDNSYLDFKNRVGNLKMPDNVNVNVIGIRSLIPSSTVAEPHPFLFTDVSPYTDGYEFAYSINLDWGHKNYISHFYYDENENLYLRYSGNAPYMTFVEDMAVADGRTRSKESMEQLSFSNVIIQRVFYDYTDNNKIMPVMQSVNRGNADIFIGGRYIPGYWVRESTTSPTVYFDDKGNEIQLTRGKTFIAHMPPEALLTYTAESTAPMAE